jgi:hypothetical protein
MKYRIMDTTDHKYRGMVLELNEIEIGMKIRLEDYTFEVDRIFRNGDEVKLFSYNYIVLLKEV